VGLATHLGLVADLPTIGVAKSRLVGEGVEPELAAGSFNVLIWKGKQVGLILRTRKGIKPLYVSPGHRITMPECLEITLGCVGRFRLPLPVRQADLLSRRLRA
jgi:deoxyribonuclease V